MAALGVLSIFRSREYYRVTVFKKAQLERLLGYDQSIQPDGSAHAALAISTTRGMRGTRDVLAWSDADLRALRLEPGSLVFYSAAALVLAGLIDGGFAGYLLIRGLVPYVRVKDRSNLALLQVASRIRSSLPADMMFWDCVDGGR